MTWERRAERRSGDHSFKGPVLLTEAVYERLVYIELHQIVSNLREQVNQGKLFHHHQILDNKYTGETLYWISNLSEGAKRSGLFSRIEIWSASFTELMFEHEFRGDKRHRIRYNYFPTKDLTNRG